MKDSRRRKDAIQGVNIEPLSRHAGVSAALASPEDEALVGYRMRVGKLRLLLAEAEIESRGSRPRSWPQDKHRRTSQRGKRRSHENIEESPLQTSCFREAMHKR